MARQKRIKDKMMKTDALLTNPIISQHVPETVWYSQKNLRTILNKYGVAYIKPNYGKQGNRIMRVKLLSESDCELSYINSKKQLAFPDASAELEISMNKDKFIIQQGIDLATVQNCPFDIRMVLQKPYSTWELTLTSAKVALREDAIVTNVSKGAQDYLLTDILQKYDQKLDPMHTYRELIDLAHQIANILGSKFPLRIIGLDMAVDKKGKVWFIEANTQPQCAKCKEVNDKIAQYKYERAKSIIHGKTRN